jgi:hypothetical protein
VVKLVGEEMRRDDAAPRRPGHILIPTPIADARTPEPKRSDTGWRLAPHSDRHDRPQFKGQSTVPHEVSMAPQSYTPHKP